MRKLKRHSDKQNRFSMAFPILTIIAIVLIFSLSSFYEKSWSYNWNGIRKQVQDTIEVAQYEGISTGVVGYAAKKPKQFERRNWIMRNATELELSKLTEYPNGTIKAIAYEGLLRKVQPTEISEILFNSMNEDEYFVYYQAGCTGIRLTISEYLVEHVLMLYGPQADWGSALKPNYNLSSEDKETIVEEYRGYKKSQENEAYRY